MNRNKTIQRFGILIVLLALMVLSCSTVGDIPNLFATETPTPTTTFTPTATSTPTQTPSPTPSPTSLPTGVGTEKQSDGSTLFIDYDNKYQLILPKDWIVIPLSSRDLAEMLKKMSENNPEFKDIAEAFKHLDPNVIRVVALYGDPKYTLNGFSTNLTITAIEDTVMSSMPMDFVTGAFEESLKQRGVKILSSSTVATINANGVEIGTFEFQQTASTATGASVQAFSKAILFQTNGKMIMIQLATPRQIGKELLPVIDEVSNSVKLMEP